MDLYKQYLINNPEVTKIERIKARIYYLMDMADDEERIGKIFDISMLLLIFLNFIDVILQTDDNLAKLYSNIFSGFETFSVIVFTIEYSIRIWTCTSQNTYKKPFIGRLKFLFSPFSIIDLMAILPFYLPLIVPFDLRTLRIIRGIRIIRLLKMERYFHSLDLIIRVIRKKINQLVLVLFFALINVILFSTIMYNIEHKIQPDKFTTLLSTIYWTITTMTTVGYGDICPISTWGKVVANLISLLGILLFAVPAGILSAGFYEELIEKKKCPKCGTIVE